MSTGSVIADSLQDLKVVLVHDWLTGMRGGEKVLEAFCRIFPQAPIYTLLHIKGKLSPIIESREIHTSFIQSLPLAVEKYRYYLPLFPRAAESLKLPPCHLVLSTSHCTAKGVHPPSSAVHVSYVHTPMRYVWDMYEAYFGPQRGGLPSRVMPFFRSYLQRWDVASSSRVDHFIANSSHVARRIEKHYGRKARVIHPPVETGRFAPAQEPEDYYLVVSALVPYKRVDLAVKACSASGRKLKVVGAGPELQNLKDMAGPTVEFLGWQPDEALPGLYARCRALLFPGEEDFGITPVECMASGRPVVALGRGGALETVCGPGGSSQAPTAGCFFGQEETGGLLRAMDDLETRLHSFDPQALAAHAAGFETSLFMEKICRFLEEQAIY